MPIEGRAGLLGELCMLTGLGEVGELVEATADRGKTAEKGVGGCVVPRPRDRAEGRLADEARRRPPADSCSLGDAGELLRVEANQLGSGAALRHSGSSVGRDDRLIAPFYEGPSCQAVRILSEQGHRTRPLL